MNQSVENDLKKYGIEYSFNTNLSSFTTIGVGGAADILAVAKNTSDLKSIVEIAVNNNIKYFVLGKGSNVIIMDNGFPGMVILNNCNEWHLKQYKKPETINNQTHSRYNVHELSQYKNLKPDKSERQSEKILISADSGIRISKLITTLFKENIIGLQWFAGIPATVGGAIYMNMHGGEKYFGDFVSKALVTDGKNTKWVDNNYFQFEYDWSILHQTKEVVLCAELVLYKGDISKAQKWANEWSKIKSIQPQHSAGCIFKNLDKKEQIKNNLPSDSIGYLIDKVLGLKGKNIGGAKISEKHAAFIENTGDASANDVVDLIKLIKDSAKNKLNLDLKTEVQIIGKN